MKRVIIKLIFIPIITLFVLSPIILYKLDGVKSSAENDPAYQLLEAAKNAQYNSLRLKINSGADVNATTKWPPGENQSALHLAIPIQFDVAAREPSGELLAMYEIGKEFARPIFVLTLVCIFVLPTKFKLESLLTDRKVFEAEQREKQRRLDSLKKDWAKDFKKD